MKVFKDNDVENGFHNTPFIIHASAYNFREATPRKSETLLYK